MPTPDELLTETFRRFMTNWSVITSLRQVTEAGLPYAERALAEEHAATVHFISNDPRYQRIFVGNDKPFSPELAEFLRTGMTRTAITNARAAVDAASIVFAHSMLDDCAWSFCEICAFVSPQDWESGIDERKIPLQTAREKGYEAIRKELLQEKLMQLERESLLKKVDTLFILCPPPKGFVPISNYTFDRTRLERIDKDRHKIIHSSAYGKPLTDAEEDLAFLQKTANYLMAMVNNKYDVRIDPAKFMPQKPAAAVPSNIA